MFSLSASARRRSLIGSGLVAGAAMVAASLAPASDAATAAASGTGFRQVNLISDVPGLARVTDFRVSNPWGIVMCPDTPVWINNNNGGTSEVYSTNPLALHLVVEVPALPTGIACNDTKAFVAHQGGHAVPTKFLFSSLDGSLSGWGGTASPINEAIRTFFDRNNGYLGMAIAKTANGPRLYAASFQGLQVFNGRFKMLNTGNRFVDPGINAKRMAAYNVAVFGKRLYVAYADAQGGNGGAVSVFTLNGMLIKHLSSDKRLNAPWGMAMAPKHWGKFGGMLLVGNVNNGQIDVLDPMTGAFKGRLRDANGDLLVNSGLWGLSFGNGITGTPRTLLFAAGIDDYAHGLFGMISPN